MTPTNLTLKAAATVAALALTAAAAPSAFAGDSVYSNAAKRVKAQVASDVSNNRATRSERNTPRVRSEGRTRNSTRTRNNDRSRNNERVRDTRRGNNRSRAHNSRSRDFVSLRDTKRHSYRNGYRSGYRTASHRGYDNYRRGRGFRNNGYRSNYRSNAGISFSFGSPGFSSYRWAASPHAFYRPGRVSYASYRNRTQCSRVVVDGFHYGTLRPVSVKQCYNPWDGHYIVQGSERVEYNYW